MRLIIVDLHQRITELEGANQDLRVRLAVADSEKSACVKREEDLMRRLEGTEKQLAAVIAMKQ